MHARELVEVAALVALHGPLLARARIAPASHHLEQYWASSKCRYDHWSQTLKTCASLHPEQTREDFDHWIVVRSVLDEIFTSEILTRVWTAVIVACDRHWGVQAAEPIARNVLATHLEARQRALVLLLHGQSLNTHQAVAINRVRRRAERWTDVLVGGLLHLGDLGEFAFEAERAEDFAADLAAERAQPGGRQAWRLTLVSLRNAFQSGLSAVAANPEANARITASILGCFPPDVFDSTGILQSPWMMRLTATASDAQGMITDLLQVCPPRAGRDARAKPRRFLR